MRVKADLRASFWFSKDSSNPRFLQVGTWHRWGIILKDLGLWLSGVAMWFAMRQAFNDRRAALAVARSLACLSSLLWEMQRATSHSVMQLVTGCKSVWTWFLLMARQTLPRSSNHQSGSSANMGNSTPGQQTSCQNVCSECPAKHPRLAAELRRGLLDDGSDRSSGSDRQCDQSSNELASPYADIFSTSGVGSRAPALSQSSFPVIPGLAVALAVSTVFGMAQVWLRVSEARNIGTLTELITSLKPGRSEGGHFLAGNVKMSYPGLDIRMTGTIAAKGKESPRVSISGHAPSGATTLDAGQLTPVSPANSAKPMPVNWVPVAIAQLIPQFACSDL